MLLLDLPTKSEATFTLYGRYLSLTGTLPLPLHVYAEKNLDEAAEAIGHASQGSRRGSSAQKLARRAPASDGKCV